MRVIYAFFWFIRELFGLAIMAICILLSPIFWGLGCFIGMTVKIFISGFSWTDRDLASEALEEEETKE